MPGFTGELDEMEVRLKYTLQKSFRPFARETGISRSSATTARMLVNLKSYKATVIHALQTRVPLNRVEGQSLQNAPPIPKAS
jgi:hypothetical protein